jgi:hypothetical protein
METVWKFETLNDEVDERRNGRQKPEGQKVEDEQPTRRYMAVGPRPCRL